MEGIEFKQVNGAHGPFFPVELNDQAQLLDFEDIFAEFSRYCFRRYLEKGISVPERCHTDGSFSQRYNISRSSGSSALREMLKFSRMSTLLLLVGDDLEGLTFTRKRFEGIAFGIIDDFNFITGILIHHDDGKILTGQSFPCIYGQYQAIRKNPSSP